LRKGALLVRRSTRLRVPGGKVCLLTGNEVAMGITGARRYLALIA